MNQFSLTFYVCDGNKASFKGTKKEIHKQIDKYNWILSNNIPKSQQLKNISIMIDILKYGYFHEFRYDDYLPSKITIDNAIYIEILKI